VPSFASYAYFALAKRYGGVPLITAVQKYDGDVEALKVPRSTEKETWDFVLKECDIAIANLGRLMASRRKTRDEMGSICP
jgi:L-lactate utilization protein LutC